MTRYSTMSETLSYEAIAEKQAKARAQIQRIRLNDPRQQRAKFEIERLRLQGRSRLSPDDPTSGLAIISNSGAGKSATAKLVISDFQKSPAYDPAKKQIVHVTLATTSSARSAIVSCLMAISDEYPKKTVTEEEATKKLQIAIEENGVLDPSIPAQFGANLSLDLQKRQVRVSGRVLHRPTRHRRVSCRIPRFHAPWRSEGPGAGTALQAWHH